MKFPECALFISAFGGFGISRSGLPATNYREVSINNPDLVTIFFE